MMIGMLWFSREPFMQRIVTAMDFYEQKYGTRPTYCEVNPSDFIDGKLPIEIRVSKSILPYHLWIGVKT